MSFLFADPAEIHTIARRIRLHGATLRERAHTLTAHSETTRWYSPAASRFRDDVRVVADRMRASAVRLESAADALDRHARRVDHALALARRVAVGGLEVAVDVGTTATRLAGSGLHAIGIG